MIVLLFDIDGTLMTTGGAGQAALDRAFVEEFGVERTRDVPISGRTDRGIVIDLLQAHGIPGSPENWDRFRTAYIRHLPRQMQARSGQLLPGIESLLELLAPRPDVACGLLTGNLREGARIKLNFFDIHHYFRFGGFGDESLDRNHVAELALCDARRHVDEHHRKELVLDRTWVIGDTPLDIRCARWVGAKVCAVATGTHPRAELAADHPDILLDDLSDAAQVVEVLTG